MSNTANSINLSPNKYPQIGIIVLLLSIVYYISYIFWGLDDDIYYWCNSFDNYSSDYVGTLTLWIGHCWSLLFGNSILSVRILALIFSTTAILLVFFYLFPRGTRHNNLHYLSTAFILSASSINIMFRPDTTTLLCACVLFVLMAERKKNLSFTNTLGISLTSAIAIASRFPNIVILVFVPLMDLLLININKKITMKNWFLNTIIYIVSSLFVYYGLEVILTQDLNWPNQLLLSMQNETEGTHSLPILLERYFSTFNKTLSVIIKAMLFFAIPCYISHKFIKLKAIRHLISLIALLYTLKVVMSQEYWPFPPISGWDRFVSFCLFALMAINIYIKKNEKGRYYYLCIYFLLMAFCIAGSDTGILKIFPFAVIFAPSILKNFFNNNLSLAEYKYTILPIFLIAGIYFSFKHHDRYEHQFWTTSYNTNFSKLDYVLLSKEDNAVYNQFHKDIENIIKDSPCVFYGARHGHWMYYLSGKKTLYEHSYLMSSKDNTELNKVLVIMRATPNCYFIDSSNITNKNFLKNLKTIKSNKDYTIYKYNKI